MKMLWYVLTMLLGAIGVLGVLRSLERLMSGEGLSPAQLLIAFIMLLLAVVCLRKARAVK